MQHTTCFCIPFLFFHFEGAGSNKARAREGPCPSLEMVEGRKKPRALSLLRSEGKERIEAAPATNVQKGKE